MSEYIRPGGMMEAVGTKQAHIADAIDTTIGSLQHAVERINSVEHRLSHMADRIVGSRPTPMPTTGNTVAAVPTVQGLLGDLGGSVERLFTQLERFNERQ